MPGAFVVPPVVSTPGSFLDAEVYGKDVAELSDD
jgi:hypothetical protein